MSRAACQATRNQQRLFEMSSVVTGGISHSKQQRREISASTPYMDSASEFAVCSYTCKCACMNMYVYMGSIGLNIDIYRYM